MLSLVTKYSLSRDVKRHITKYKDNCLVSNMDELMSGGFLYFTEEVDGVMAGTYLWCQFFRYIKMHVAIDHRQKKITLEHIQMPSTPHLFSLSFFQTSWYLFWLLSSTKAICELV